MQTESHKRPFVALYKCHRGGEWFKTSLEGVAPAIDGVVAVFGKPWLDTAIQENCLEPLRQFASENPQFPVDAVHTNAQKQDEQYAIGMEFIKSKYGVHSTAMIIDTDEIWLAGDAAKLRRFVEGNPDSTYFRVKMNTYIRSPNYQIYPPEPNRPTVAVNCDKPYCVGIRFSLHTPQNVPMLPDVMMQHYSFVRESYEDIALKFYATESQEKARSNPAWLQTTWNALPNVSNFHMAMGHERCWRSIITIPESKMPECVLRLPFVKELLWKEAARVGTK